MFSDRHIDVCLPKLVHCTNKGIAIIAVFFADMDFDMDHAIETVRQARLKGVMIDTARKKAGGLLKHKNILQLEYFVNRAKQNDLLTGLAGSLTIKDIPVVLKANPDYIGFRTALCTNNNRESLLDKKSIQNIRKRIPIPCELRQRLA